MNFHIKDFWLLALLFVTIFGQLCWCWGKFCTTDEMRLHATKACDTFSSRSTRNVDNDNDDATVAAADREPDNDYAIANGRLQYRLFNESDRERRRRSAHYLTSISLTRDDFPEGGYLRLEFRKHVDQRLRRRHIETEDTMRTHTGGHSHHHDAHVDQQPQPQPQQQQHQHQHHHHRHHSNRHTSVERPHHRQRHHRQQFSDDIDFEALQPDDEPTVVEMREKRGGTTPIDKVTYCCRHSADCNSLLCRH